MAKKVAKPRDIKLGTARALFIYGLDALETAYKTSTEPIYAVIQDANSAGKTVAVADADAIADYDEEAYTIIYNAHSVASLLQEAFLISLFHFWERQANFWLGTPGDTYDHEETMVWLRTNGCTPDDATIKKLSLAANYLKHGSGKSSVKLRAIDASFFNPPKIPSMGSSTHHAQTTPEMLQMMFEVVRRSGP